MFETSYSCEPKRLATGVTTESLRQENGRSASFSYIPCLIRARIDMLSTGIRNAGGDQGLCDNLTEMAKGSPKEVEAVVRAVPGTTQRLNAERVIAY